MNPSNFELIDPRGSQPKADLQLAPRPSLDELKRGPILFYNNTKLFFCNYNEIFEQVKRNLIRDGIENFIDFVETVRGKTREDLKAYAAKLAKSNPVAAIVALGDMGTSPATTIVSIELEKLGIPTLYFTAPPGTALVKAVAYYQAGRLCITSVDIYQGSTVEEIRAEVDKQWTSIMEALTLPKGQIENRADLRFELDGDVPSRNGIIRLDELKTNHVASSSDPGAGLEEVTDLFNKLNISDGLPIIPPTKNRLESMFAYTPLDADTVLAEEIGPTGKDIKVWDIAVAAVMAGCKPQYMPVLIAAFQAMADPGYNFLQSVTTSHPGGNMVLVSGPLTKELGLYGGQGCLGPGFQANLTIGRAVNLVLINCCRSVPGYADLSCISSQAELTYCFGEDPELTPWQTINCDRYNPSTTTVYVLKAEPPHDIIDFLSLSSEDLLDTIIDSATTLGSNNAYIPGPLVVVLTPDHAWLLNREGWDKDSLRNYIHQRAHHPTPMVRNRGLVPVRPESFDKKHPMPVTRNPEDIEIVVAGGRGGHSAIILPWALHSEAIVKPILLPNGTVPDNIENFKR